jgi:hypothetical protein
MEVGRTGRFGEGKEREEGGLEGGGMKVGTGRFTRERREVWKEERGGEMKVGRTGRRDEREGGIGKFEVMNLYLPM